MVVGNLLKAAVIVGGVVLILFFIISITYNPSEQNEFEKFVSKYNKSYANETERAIRFKRFQVSLVRIYIKCDVRLFTNITRIRVLVVFKCFSMKYKRRRRSTV